jgi:antitoxin HicB
MRTLIYNVHIEPAEEGGYNVFVPALPGCQTQGKTYEEAVAMAKECIEGFLEGLVKAGEPIPVEENPAVVRVQVSAPDAVAA